MFIETKIHHQHFVQKKEKNRVPLKLKKFSCYDVIIIDYFLTLFCATKVLQYKASSNSLDQYPKYYFQRLFASISI